MKNILISTMRYEGDQMFKLAEKFGVGIEVLEFVEPYTINRVEDKANHIKKLLSHISPCSIHGPFVDLFPASKDPEIAKVVRKRFLEAYETAKSINAKHLIFHAGYISKAHNPKVWLNNAIDFWKRFIADTNKDIEIHIENVSADDYVLIKNLIQSVDDPIFSACLDIGHVNVNSEKTIEEWIKGLNTHIKYVHLHNNDDLADKHYGLYKGNINMLRTLELLEVYAPDAIWSLETRPDETEESLLWLEENGFISRSVNLQRR